MSALFRKDAINNSCHVRMQEGNAVRMIDLTSLSVRTIAGPGPDSLPSPALTAYFQRVTAMVLLPDESALYFVTENYDLSSTFLSGMSCPLLLLK